MTFVALEDGTFKFSGTSANTQIQYSLDSGETWNTLASNTNSPTVNAGHTIMWKGELIPVTADWVAYSGGIGYFSSSGNYNVEGNVMSLLFGDNFDGQLSLSGKDFAFMNLFSGSTKLVSAENLSLPATTLTQSCYFCMFTDCTSLSSAPQLPATTLANQCYYRMFRGCTSLTTAPQLPTTTLAQSCYYSMFSNCTSLSSAPQLLATTLENSCYSHMFEFCTSLTTAPELPATTLANNCYYCMFLGCTSLTSAPQLPATTLVSNCYYLMFSDCTSLTTAPALSATTLANNCYRTMFANCTSLNSITCLATDISASNCTTNWVYGVQTTSGTFTKASNMSSWTTGNNGIPNNWTVQNYQS